MPSLSSRVVRAVLLTVLTISSLPAYAQEPTTTADAEATEPSTSDWIVEDSIDVEGEAPRDSLIQPETSAATRTRTPVEEIPQSIQIVPRRLLEEQEVRTLDQALVNVSGVVPSKPEELVLQQPLVRGFAAEIFIDGLPAFSLTPVVDPLSMINVERVEVLKGPSSTLFGGGIGAPLGGMINIVSKAPLPTERSEAGLRLGEFETLGAFFDLNRPVGEAVALRVTGEVTDAGSHLRTVDGESYSLFPTLSARFGERTVLTLRGQLSRNETLEYTGLPASITLGGDFGVDPDRFSGATNAPNTVIENRLITARLEHRISPRLDATLEARHYASSFEEYSSFPFLALFPPDPERPTEFTLIRGQLPTDVDQWTLSPRVEWSTEAGSVRHRVLAGIEIDRTRYEAATGFDFTPLGVLDYSDPEADLDFGEIPQLTSFFDDTYDTAAVFVQDQVELGDRVRVLAGLRFTRLGIEQRTPGGGPGFDSTYDELTPRLGLSVDLGAHVDAFAGYSEGFRGVLFFNGAEPPVPETSEHAEVGLKIAAPDHGLQGSVALYELVRSNVPTPDPTSPFVQVQTGEQRARGLELDLVWEPDERLSLLVAYAFADAEITRDTTFPVGDRLARVPEHSGRVALRYRGLGRWRHVGVGLGLSAGTEREITLPNQLETESYLLFDLQASIQLGPARLGLSVVNLADEDFFEPYQYLSQAVVIPTRPRSVTGTLRWRF